MTASMVPTGTLHDADDGTLVAAFLDNRREAFDVIVERHWRTVYHLCYRFVGNHEDAADLAQDVFVRAFKGLHRFKGDSSLGTWLHRVGVNVCLNRVAIKPPLCKPIGDGTARRPYRGSAGAPRPRRAHRDRPGRDPEAAAQAARHAHAACVPGIVARGHRADSWPLGRHGQSEFF